MKRSFMSNAGHVRVQVRVSRKRILESATKVMELYANGRALLELEFFGEVRAHGQLGVCRSCCLISSAACQHEGPGA